MRFALDRAPSARSVDENGFLHVKSSHITKATVNPYYGREIPGWREAGLSPEKIYYGLRDPRELQKSISTWEGLPLHIEHHTDSADDPEIRTRVGAVGKAFWANPYVDASLTVWNQQAIDAIEDGSFRELSCAYRYTPDFTPGKFEGVDYDFVMRNIRGNHVALVEEGRAGADVIVADRSLAQDADKWITVKPNGAQNTGRPCLIDGETGEVKAGMGGKFNGKNIDDIERGKNPHPVTEEKWQSRQKRVAEKQNQGAQGSQNSANTQATPEGTSLSGSLPAGRPDFLHEVDQKIMDLEQKLAEPLAYEPKESPYDHRFMGRKMTSREKDEKRVAIYEQHKDDIRPYLGDVKEGHKPLAWPMPVEKETERAVCIMKNTWLPKSMSSVKDGKVVGVNPKTLYDKPGVMTADHAYQYYLKAKINLKEDDAFRGKEKKARDNAITNDNKIKYSKIGGGIMKGIGKGLKKIFNGAKDANPDIEREEVDLAQAIIDLHKVDPNTGEIVDITEDEDKAEEIRKIIGEISGKLEPEELKKLNDALAGLAYSKATGDEEPGGGMDEEMKSAMDACGLDSDDEDMSKAFAGGVDYGEKLEKEPGEREKLDKEHESNGLKSAMDACGVDAENPQESKAFAEGVKYGEKLERNPEERKKLDEEHESEGAKEALDEDKNAEIAKILAEVPDLTDAQKKQLTASLQDLAYTKPTGDEDMPAQDKALEKPKGPRPLLASDAAIIQARAVAQAQENMRRIAQAITDVRPLVGELDMMAFDSANDVYGYTLEQSGVDKRKYDKSAWRGMVDMLRREKCGLSDRRLAQDAKPVKLEGPFAGLASISIGD